VTAELPRANDASLFGDPSVAVTPADLVCAINFRREARPLHQVRGYLVLSDRHSVQSEVGPLRPWHQERRELLVDPDEIDTTPASPSPPADA
jgi:hypothetical protein